MCAMIALIASREVGVSGFDTMRLTEAYTGILIVRHRFLHFSESF